MSYRCTNAFLYDNRIYAGGQSVADDDPILATHAAHFAKVEESFVGSETASQGPGERRTPTPAAADKEAAEAWLAAEKQYLDDVAVWLDAEEQYQTDVATWLAAEAEAKTAETKQPAPAQSRRK